MTQEEFQKRYRYDTVNDRLGEGGFGEVFKAYDTYLDKWVAIKVSKVKAEMPDLRLKNEAELVNKLPAHPNIARYEECYTFTSIAGEYDFGILQYYEYGNLLQLIRNQTLSLGQKYSLLTNLLEGIRFIHSQNIIHRDIKPQNILIVERDNTFIPKITDFGISKKLKVSKEAQYSNSLIGAGTIAYASPEQLADKTIRKNTDLWSFGVIAFQLFTDELPFNSGPHSTSSELGRQEMLKQISIGKLPDTIELVPAPWKSVIEKCLMIDPEKRIKEATDCMKLLSGQKTTENQIGKNTRSGQIENENTEIVFTGNTKRKSRNTQLQKKTKNLVLILLALVALIAVTVYYFTSPNNIQTSKSKINDTPVILPDSIELDKKTQDNTVTDSAKITMNIIPEPKPTEEVSQPEPKLETTTNKITLPNGDTYDGSTKNGKMHGKGKYYFNSDGIISKNDPMERRAESGNYIVGEWFEGELYKGKLFDKNGTLKENIIIGRN